MPKKPIEPRPAESLGGRDKAADVDQWLYKYALTFWSNYVNFKELAKSDGNKFYHSMRDYYGNGVSVVGFLRAQIKTSKGVFLDGTRQNIRSGGKVSSEGSTPGLSSPAAEADQLDTNGAKNS